MIVVPSSFAFLLLLNAKMLYLSLQRSHTLCYNKTSKQTKQYSRTVKRLKRLKRTSRSFSTGESFTAYTSLLLDEIGTTAKGAPMLKNLSMSSVFDFSKPIELLQHFFDICTVDNDIILDFFSVFRVIIMTTADSNEGDWVSSPLLEK